MLLRPEIADNKGYYSKTLGLNEDRFIPSQVSDAAKQVRFHTASKNKKITEVRLMSTSNICFSGEIRKPAILFI